MDLDEEEYKATRKLNGVEWEEDKQIQVGDYVRTNHGYIIKVNKQTTIFNMGYKEEYVDMETTIYGFPFEEEIVKHSPDLIDLIEVNDYVNGERVFATENRINDNGEKVILVENYNEWTDDGVIANKDIKTICTHEQFNSVMYKVKE